ncbi:MAG TPA: LamB/YcsF family protein, partial [Burkholderiales bacterium]|nr:LamB/YcsF family protein [Burkholderiales bacterium]
PQDMYDLVVYQAGAVEAFARAAGARLHHVKCHGALYNMAANDEGLAEAMARAVRDLGGPMLYTLSGSKSFSLAKNMGLRVAGEVFADRGYADDGTLAPRDAPGGMIEDAALAAERAAAMIEKRFVTSLSGKPIPVSPDTLCLHGDQPGAVVFAQAIRSVFAQRGVAIAAP